MSWISLHNESEIMLRMLQKYLCDELRGVEFRL
jgi:hypothetical protein